MTESARPWWRRKRWRVVAAVWLLTAAYPFSSGPLLFCVERGWLPSAPWYAAFAPLHWAVSRVPVAESAYWSYLFWWHRLAFGPSA